jgi:hypothetical protein
METSQFDNLIRSLLATPSRRRVLRGLAIGCGLWSARFPNLAHGKKGKKKLKRNRFGCVNVGGHCRGRDNVCCSGKCRGKKPRNGKKDTSACVAHHAGVCDSVSVQVACTGNPATACNPDNPYARCYRTTGNAEFCGNSALGGCVDCRKDADCQALGFGDGAACIDCPSCASESLETACVSPGIA